MILADDILAAGDGPFDVCGMLASLGRALMNAERFVLDDDVVQAGRHILRDKPSQLLAALPMCRSPYSKTWIEWGCDPKRPMQRNIYDRMRGITFHENNRYMPDRTGCLIECPTAKGDCGSLTYAWRIPGKGIAMSGVSVIFNFTEDVVAWGHRTLEGREADWHRLIDSWGRRSTDQEAQTLMGLVEGWKKVADNPEERKALLQVERHTLLWLSPHAWDFFKLALTRSSLDQVRECIMMWTGDIDGETNFILSILVMLNSRNGVSHTPIDLERLNKARHKRGRPPFLSHRITHLQLSRARTRDAEASGMTRAEMRAHMVRGHFKLRRTGVYWWSPFVRGTGSLQKRERYEVEP